MTCAEHKDMAMASTGPDQSLAGIAQLLGVEPGEDAIICAIEDLWEAYSRQHIDANNLRDSLGR
jgi:hypothetical protein